MKIAALAGGVGGAKLLLGMARVMDPHDLTIIANTGDDIVLHGLHISPDPDIITYTLAGVVNPETGWGFRDESFHALEQLKRIGAETWFNLGDRDLGTHLYRTARLREGATLSEIADTIRRALGVSCRILPMSDARVPTYLETDVGRLHLQEYFVRHRCEPKVQRIAYEGAADAEPAPAVLDAIAEADAIVICPSNPLISIGPILALGAIREALARRRARVIAISPLVGGRSLKGPTDRMMVQLGHELSPLGVARLYADVCGTMIIDTVDADTRAGLQELRTTAITDHTVMQTLEDKVRLARNVLAIAAGLCARS